jgi:hypothetical protein
MSISAYLATVVTRAQELLGDRLVGVYPSGSVAFDAYGPGRSDVDLIAVADRPSPAEVATIAGALSHDALPCPATGLEFVLYDRTTLAALTTEAGFALNLNTGRELASKAETDPGDGLTFWYPIDRDIVCQQRSAKPVAAAWALDHAPGFDRVITAALDSHARDRAAGGIVDVELARAFLTFVLARCRS